MTYWVAITAQSDWRWNKMKLMIISDIHGSYNDLEKVMHYFDEEQPDRLIILGDIL